MRNQKGKFIVLEGGDGLGKDTQLQLLREHFGEKGFLYTHEPGGTRLGDRIRELVTRKDEGDVCMEAELLLFSASRAQHVRELIRPSVESGTHVICSRFSLSTIAYQLYGRGRLHYLDAFFHIDQFVVGNTKPNLYILLDAASAVGLERQSRLGFEKDRIESEEAGFRERVCAGYRAVLPAPPYGIVIHADRAREEVGAELISIVEGCIGTKSGTAVLPMHTQKTPLVQGFSSEGLSPVW